MSRGAYLQDCLNRRAVFFTGKGGVGKTSLAWATAVLLRRQGKRVAVCAWSHEKDTLSTPIPLTDPDLKWVPLTTLDCFKEYALGVVKFERLYDLVFDNPVLRTFLLAAPGLAETVIAGKIWDLWDHDEIDHVLIDLPSSGHAVTFFRSPIGVQKIFKVGVVYKNAERIIQMFHDSSVRLDLAAMPETLPVTEAIELKQTLGKLHPFTWGFLHLNRCTLPLETPKGAGLPPNVEEWMHGHERRLHREGEAIASAKAIELPLVTHPQFAAERASEAVYALADHLEGK